MIYDAPRIYDLGDCYVAVEFGDTANLELSLRVLRLEQWMRNTAVPGIVETIATTRQLGIVFDRTETNRVRVADAVSSFLNDTTAPETVTSRWHELPVWFGDPWTADAATSHGVPPNLAYVASVNGISESDVIDILTGGDYWVSLVGFTPGTFLGYPLGDRPPLTAPKYDTPRTYTPSRTLAVAGSATCGYSIEGPGGYQMLGRLAIDIYQPAVTASWIPADGILIRAGDRVRYRAVGPREYDQIRTEIGAGTYVHKNRDEVLSFADILGVASLANSH